MIRLRQIFKVFSLLFVLNSYSQEPEDENSYDDLMNMSVEELLELDVNVQVVSNEGDKLFNSPSTVTVISRKNIEAYNFQTISEAIQTISGMMVVNTYMKKDIPTARGILQDQYANKILLLLNGIPTFNAITGEGILNRIDINDVERIEVLKGPASVLYGSNAYSGAINIVLKSDNTPGVESHAGVGNDILFSGAQASFDKEDFKFFISGNSYSKLNKNSSFLDENGESGYYDNLSFNQNFTFIGSLKDLSFLLNNYHNKEGFLGVLSSFESGAGIPHQLSGTLANIGYDHRFSEKFSINARIETDFNHRIVSRDRMDSIRSNISGYRLAASVTGNYNLSEFLTLSFGSHSDYRKSSSYSNYIKETNTIITDNNLKNKDVTEHSLFLQTEIITGKLQSIAGIRFTYNLLFGANFSPRLSMVYRFNGNNALKAIYGESFRAPSLFELYFTNPDSTIFGNTELKPEKTRSFEVAYLKTIDHFFVQLLGYYGTHMDKIQRIAGEYGTVSTNSLMNVYSNVHEFNAYGFESEIKYKNPKALQLFLNYSYSSGSKEDSTQFEDHYNFKYVPEHQFTIGIQKDFGNHFSTSGIYRFWSGTNGPKEKIGYQQTLDLTLGFKHEFHSFRFFHTISVKNVFDNQLQFPDYVRRNINSIPFGDRLSIFYSLKLTLL